MCKMQVYQCFINSFELFDLVRSHRRGASEFGSHPRGRGFESLQVHQKAKASLSGDAFAFWYGIHAKGFERWIAICRGHVAAASSKTGGNLCFRKAETQRIPSGPPRRCGRHIVRSDFFTKVTSRSFCRSSFPNATRFAGLAFGFWV